MGTDGSSREDNFGALKMDGSPKGAFTTRSEGAEHLPRLKPAEQLSSSVEEARKGLFDAFYDDVDLFGGEVADIGSAQWRSAAASTFGSDSRGRRRSR